MLFFAISVVIFVITFCFSFQFFGGGFFVFLYGAEYL
jgi:hypothetical protein